ncbi:hydrogenase 4 subunit B [Paramagnetospirillum kuznetsovii]|uniref:Hydrogenase 4 subunit B n=1 Tax=Paramagnetospirillum kuznetsovii TaxID=2053833 RepID=A0A364P1D0_9PROT|nr:hydrogenase 4 subunit B [Paramagnetospirillum kuznetsovii]RAU22925.1 hydrogenase 4 subunit B [Paramagnetospirillum kuznetsovii]
MLIASALSALLALAVFGVLAGGEMWRHRVVYLGCAIASLVLLAGGLKHLGQTPGTGPAIVLPIGLPWMAAHFRLDNLSALFMVIVNLGTTAASVFGIGYCDHVPEPRRVTPFFPLFLFGMNAVLISDDAFMFLVSWEFMSLASWLLVLSDHRNEESRSAAFVYLMMATFGTFCLLTCFGLMAGAEGGYSFPAMRLHGMDGLTSFLVVLLALLGAGSKAGLVPLHAWLPLAHPAAPSHVSALMSGVMTKVALYGLIRILFDLHGHVAWGWGAVLMGIGGVTAVLGVLYAILQDDLKKLLAYSTVENIGVVVIGLGLAIAFKDSGEKALAALALVAGLYHIINHSIFKTLLFLSAGAVITATGERSLNKLGGLLNRMPWTGAATLVGALAISALPPLNGFVSEWLIFQSLFKGPSLPHWAMKFGVPVVGAMLALAAALAASCFVRAYGIAFLGRPRSQAAAEAHTLPFSMRWSMAVLAALCIILGAVPVTVTDAVSHVVQPLTGVSFAVSADLGWPWLSPVSSTRGSYSGTVLVMTGLSLFVICIVLVHGFGTTRVRRADAWDCGHRENIVNAQYSGESFAQPLRRVFCSSLFGVKETVTMPDPGDMAPAKLEVRVIDRIWVFLYLGIGRVVGFVADRVNRMQFLTVRRYLLMMFATLVFMLLVVAVRQQK